MKKLTKLFSLIMLLSLSCACAIFSACDVHRHSYQYSVTKEATCEFSGITYGYCECGKVDEKIIPALGHTFQNDVCTVCGFNRLSDHVHTVVIDEGLPATCESIGLTEGSHCSACNMILVKQEVVPAIGHLFMKYTFDNNSTCQQDGTKTAVCDREGCNVTDTRVAKDTKTEHQYNSTTVAPTCVAKGYTLYLCACGDSYMGDYVNTIAHVYNQEVAKSEYLMQEVTCKSPAQYYKSCSCGKAGTQSFVYGGTLAHAYSNTWSYSSTHHWYEATCGCDAISRYEMHNSVNGFCSACGAPTASTVGVMYDLSADGTYAEVIGYTGTDKRVVIASEYQGKPVTHIYKEAFRNNDNITEIIFPETLLTIGDYAFYDCDGLTSVVIPDSVTLIGGSAFYDCSSLISVVIGDSVTSIGYYAFDYCRSLTSIVIPDSVTSIGDYTFANCSSLTEVNYLGTIDQWVEIEFGNSYANPLYYAKQLKINDEVVTKVNLTTATLISDYAFYNCSSLTSVVIGDSVTSIGKQAFAYCSSLTSVVIGDGATSIGYSAFYGCSSLTSIVIGDGVTLIGSYAFGNCSKLKFNEYENCKYLGSKDNPYFALIEGVNSNLSSITIHNDAKIIADKAFYEYSRLTSIVIGDGVTSIGDYAFAYCSSLTSIKYSGTQAQWNAISKGTGWNSRTGSYTITYNYAGE